MGPIGGRNLLDIVDNRMIACAACKCQYCANNVEILLVKVQPGEIKEECFNCSGCRECTGNSKDKGKLKIDCDRFALSGYGASARRRIAELARTDYTETWRY
ncbi:MAG: hypothetical protein HFH68_07030 [Lachnospiraceae bacterium]|nr:hypothetical protein [Lachnospiraceae bacterium]